MFTNIACFFFFFFFFFFILTQTSDGNQLDFHNRSLVQGKLMIIDHNGYLAINCIIRHEWQGLNHISIYTNRYGENAV